MRRLFAPIEQLIDNSIGRRNLGFALMFLILIYFLIFPQDQNQSPYVKSVFIGGFFYAILSSSWALLAGIAGQFSFAHMALMGIGAYVAGLLARDGLDIVLLGIYVPPESITAIGSIIIGTLAAGLCGLIIGLLVLRLRSAYLALFTIAFAELFRLVVLTEFAYSGGMNGLSLRRIIEMSDVSAARDVAYYIMFGLLLASLAVMYFVSNSRIGLFLRAMREDEDAASALGVNVVRYKTLIFVLTSLIIGLAGAVFFSNVGAERITPEVMEILQMSLVIAYAVIGGMESLLGAAVGAFLSRYLLEAMRAIPLPVTMTFDLSPEQLLVRLLIATVTIGFSLYLAVYRFPAGRRRFWGTMLVVSVVTVNIIALISFSPEPSIFEPGAWRFALFGIVMVMTLRFARNGLLFPILSWFNSRDVVKRETVSIRGE